MKIEILQLLEGARQARGLTVIIDVFRAFSTVCYATDRGAGPIYPVGTLEDAFQMKSRVPEAMLIGERHERKPEGFDFGNSPYLLLKGNIRGVPLIHTTSSGTQGIVNAIHAEQIITGSFVNTGAVLRYIRLCRPDRVSLVCMGYACQYPTDEDTLCADFIRNELNGLPNDWEMIKSTIRQGTGARFFEDASQEWAPREDFGLCLDLHRFDFVLKAERLDHALFLRRIDVPANDKMENKV